MESKVKCPNPGMTSPNAFPVFFKKLMVLAREVLLIFVQQGCVGGGQDEKRETSVSFRTKGAFGRR